MKRPSSKPVSSQQTPDLSRLNIERKISKAMSQNTNPNTSLTSYTSQKILNLHRYLDDIDNTPSQSQNISLSHSIPLQESLLLDQILKESQQNIETQNVNLLRIEVTEAQKTIESLKSLLEAEQKKSQETDEKFRKAHESELKLQKEEMEATINRHLGFIDELIKDKTLLNEEIESLLTKIKAKDEIYERSMNELKENHNKEIKNQKEVVLASEKTKKEKWMNEKLQEIKAMTIKGLEPELEGLMAKHKKDLKKIEEKYERDLKNMKTALQETHEKDLLEMRKRLMIEYEDSYQKNRDLEFTKLKEAYLRLESQSVDDRETLKKLHYKEIQELEKNRKEQMEGYLKELKKAQEVHLEDLKKNKIESQEKIDRMRIEILKENEEIKKKLLNEQEIWKEQKLNDLTKEFEKKAKDLEESMAKERDQQLELVIAKFAEENEDMDSKAFAKYQKKLEDLNLSKSNEITNLQRKIKVMENQLEGLKLNYQEVESEKTNFEKEKEGVLLKLSEKDQEITKLTAEVAKLKSQTSVSDEIIESLERNFTRRIEKERESYEQKLSDMRRNIDEIKIVHYKEMEELTDKQGRELEMMEERVKKVVGRKDGEINRLGEEIKQKSLEVEKYKELMDKQRRDLMKK